MLLCVLATISGAWVMSERIIIIVIIIIVRIIIIIVVMIIIIVVITSIMKIVIRVMPERLVRYPASLARPRTAGWPRSVVARGVGAGQRCQRRPQRA
jgi:hypothetical protein